jgi:hypothetical protein
MLKREEEAYRQEQQAKSACVERRSKKADATESMEGHVF